MQPNDPYAAYAPPAQPLYRQNVFVPQGAGTVPLLGPGIRNVKLALGIAQVVTGTAALVFVIAGGIQGGGADVLFAVGGALFLLCNALLMAWAGVSLVWIHRFWSWIPPDQRHTSMWKKYISPNQATFFMLIPYFGFYWIFVMNLGIAEILERMRVAYPTDKPPAKTIALLNSIVPLLFFPAAPFLDYVFDKHVEGMAADMQARMPGAESLALR
ncbi:hypothetical protein BH11MYX4_BH11MYX4_41680 [soil metagenome]